MLPVLNLKVAQFVSADPVMAHQDMVLKEVHQLMEGNNISHLPVINDTNTPVGLVSERDVRAFYLSSDFSSRKAKTIMNSEFLCFSPQEDLKKVVNAMNQFNQCAAIIIDKSQDYIGIFTVSDTLKALDHIYAHLVKKMEAQ